MRPDHHAETDGERVSDEAVRASLQGFSAKDIAGILSIPIRTAYDVMRDMPVVPGKPKRVPRKDFEAWLDAHTEGPSQLAEQKIPRMVGGVYFIQQGTHGLIKIGYSQNIYTRVSTHKSSIPVHMRYLGSIRGDRSMESAIHKTIVEHRHHGEWFHPRPPVVRLVGLAIIEGRWRF